MTNTLHRNKAIQRTRLQTSFLFLPVLLSFAYLELDLGFLQQIPFPIIAALLGLNVLVAMLQCNVRCDWLSLSLICFLPITIFLAHPLGLFRSWERCLGFILVLTFASPLIQGRVFRRYREIAFYSFLIGAAIIGVASFFCYFLNINYMVHDLELVEEYITDVGKFGGLTRQSMMLGPLSGFGALFAFYCFIRYRRWYWILFSVLSFITVLLAASRIAFVATLVGMVSLLWHFSSSRKQFFRLAGIILLSVVLLWPVWNMALSRVQQKQLYHEDDTEMFDSRTQKYTCRLQEFASSPLWGVGFSAIDPKFKDKYSSNGTIEPGSSWLAVLSMTGIIGFLLFLRSFVRSILVVFRQRDDESQLLFSCLLLFSVHMIAEGYIFAIGNPLCYFFWLILGVCFDKRRQLVSKRNATLGRRSRLWGMLQPRLFYTPRRVR